MSLSLREYTVDSRSSLIYQTLRSKFLIGDVFILPALLVAGGRFFHPLGGVKK